MSVQGYAEEGTAILRRLHDQWGTTTPVAWPNEDFDPEREGGDPEGAVLAEKQPWIRPTLLASDAARREIGTAGNRTFRHPGMLLVQVFVPKGEGDGVARLLSETVCGIFRGVSADGITYEGPTGEAPMARADGDDGHGWYMWTVTVPYTRDSLY